MSDPAVNLLAAASRAREFAVAPFSNFQVGAALLTADGQIVTGCNVENATYGLTMCRRARRSVQSAIRRAPQVHPCRGRCGHRRTDSAVRRLPAAALGIWRRPPGNSGNLQRETARHKLTRLVPASVRRTLVDPAGGMK